MKDVKGMSKIRLAVGIVLMVIGFAAWGLRITLAVSDYVYSRSTKAIIDDGSHFAAVWTVGEIPENTEVLEISSVEMGRKIRGRYKHGDNFMYSDHSYLFMSEESMNTETLSEIAKLDIKELILDEDVTDLNPLSYMQSLERIWVTYRVEHFSPTFSGSFPNLKYLEIDTNVDTLGDIVNITSLRTLELRYTTHDIFDISGIENLTDLEVLNLNNTKVADISGLEGLVKMRELYINYTDVYDISALENMRDLEVLSASQNYYNSDNKPLITDIRALKDKPKLRKVDLYGTDITDITPLANDLALEEVELSYTDVADLTPLMNLTKLEFIGAYKCGKIKDSDMNEFYDWVLSLDHEVHTEGVGHVYTYPPEYFFPSSSPN